MSKVLSILYMLYTLSGTIKNYYVNFDDAVLFTIVVNIISLHSVMFILMM